MKGKAPKVVKFSPDEQPGKLKVIGGSASNHFNNTLVNQAISSLWRAHSDSAALDVQYGATISALMGIRPADEIEGMLAAQMVATHNAARTTPQWNVIAVRCSASRRSRGGARI